MKLIVVLILSPAKTFVFLFGFGEYTSWYQDGEFVSQYGVETATLPPQGKMPSDDFLLSSKGGFRFNAKIRDECIRGRG